MTDELENLRAEIDKTDAELVSALCRRIELTEKVGEYKKRQGMAVYVPERETAVLSKAAELAGERRAEDVTEVYRLIIKLSRDRQEGARDE